MTASRRLRGWIPLLALIAGALAGCRNGAPTGTGLRGEGSAVLFIGNSYLYTQDVPGIVQAMAATTGDQLAVASVTGANLALIDHWNIGTARARIAKGGWKWVVLQQGPSSVEVNRDSLRLMAQRFAGEIRAAGGIPALFSAWPASTRPQDYPRAIESYRLAASDVQGAFLPVASAWLAAWTRDPAVGLYADALHPSEAGAYLAALVVYACLLQRSPTDVPATLSIIGGRTMAIPPAQATLLKEVAAATVADSCVVGSADP